MNNERERFERAYRHLDLSREPDAWGVPHYKHSHVDALWEGWSRALLPEPLRAGEGERAAIVAFLRGETQSAYTDPQYDIGFNLAAAIERGDHLPALSTQEDE